MKTFNNFEEYQEALENLRYCLCDGRDENDDIHVNADVAEKLVSLLSVSDVNHELIKYFNRRNG